MDILGIIINFTINTNILIYFAFYYDPIPRTIHFIIMTLSGIWAGVWTVKHGKNGQRWTKWQEGPSLCALINILLGGLWCLPFGHFVLLHGAEVSNIVETLALMGLFQLIGAFFHSTHTPERFFRYAQDF